MRQTTSTCSNKCEHVTTSCSGLWKILLTNLVDRVQHKIAATFLQSRNKLLTTCSRSSVFSIKWVIKWVSLNSLKQYKPRRASTRRWTVSIQFIYLVERQAIFYSVWHQTILFCLTPDYFTLSNARRFYSVERKTFTVSNADKWFYYVKRLTILVSNVRRFYSVLH